ncbi:MAG: hypothetical protein V1806_04020 [Pseudomonadota bacterium]
MQHQGIASRLISAISLLLLSNLFATTIFTTTIHANEIAHRDDSLGLEFPTAIGLFRYLKVEKYKDVGLGYSVRYIGPDIMKADIYVYNKNLSQLPDGIVSQEVKNEMREVAQGLYLFQKRGIYKDVLKIREDIYPAPSKGKIVRYLWSIFSYSQNPGERVSYYGTRKSETFLTVHRGNFIKIRLTCKAQSQEDNDYIGRKFVDTLSSYIVK